MRSSLPEWTFGFGFAVSLGVLAIVVGAAAFNDSQDGGVAAGEPWTDEWLIQPEDLAKTLSNPAAKKPIMLQIGIQYLYRTSHIAGSRFVGTASTPEGIRKLKDEARNLPTDTGIVLYCGCCPWNVCPNTRPAFKALRDLGFNNVKVLYLAQNLQHDWVQKGFPTEKRTSDTHGKQD